MTLKAKDETMEETPDEPPEGSWWTKVSLGCAISEKKLSI